MAYHHWGAGRGLHPTKTKKPSETHVESYAKPNCEPGLVVGTAYIGGTFDFVTSHDDPLPARRQCSTRICSPSRFRRTAARQLPEGNVLRNEGLGS